MVQESKKKRPENEHAEDAKVVGRVSMGAIHKGVMPQVRREAHSESEESSSEK